MAMNEVTARAINSINKILESSSDSFPNCEKPKLINTRSLLHQLFEFYSANNKWIRLVRQRLTRLMDYNDLSKYYFWEKMRDDILYALKGPHDTNGVSSSWKSFLDRMKFEEELEKRKLQFQLIKREEKNLHQLFCEHKTFLEEYLQKCISFHSKVQVRGLVEDLDDFLCKNCGLSKSSFTPISRKHLEEKLKCIEIPLDCSNRSLEDVQDQFSQHLNSYKQVNKNLTNFLPSAAELRFYQDHSTTFEKVLQSKRWIVILGDPGCAKTSILRWVTRVFAETVNRGDEKVILREYYCYPVRIPILIRIGEFAEWLNQHQNKTLIDYIGKHTWFTEPYTYDDSRCVLKELIYHGHALILLDGLDEIPNVGKRGEIVDLVRKFIDEYVRAPDFISAFDNELFSIRRSGVVETKKPSESGGNQIIITSRTVGYQLYPLDGPFIEHCSLKLMNHYKAKEFVSNLITQVEKSVLEVLSVEGINIEEGRVGILSTKRYNAVQSMFEKSSGLLMSSPSLLSLICKIIFQSSDEFHPQSRVEVYNHAVQSALRTWTTQEPSISEDLLTNFLINLSTYLHLESPSGLMDTYDMEQLCYLTLQQQGVPSERAKLREYVNKLIFTLESNIGIVSEVGLQVFGFQHLSFQEYFVSQCLVRGSSIEEIAERILSFAINPRFRESIRLALEWISWKWSQNAYDTFCNLLITRTEGYSIPIGASLVCDALNNVQTLPSTSIIFGALNSLLYHPCNTVAEMRLISSLSKLHEDFIVEWMQLHLKDEKRLSKFCQCLLLKCRNQRYRTEIQSKSKLSFISQQLWSLQNLSTLGESIIDQTLQQIVTAVNASAGIFNDKLSSYLLSHNICTSNIHPLILSVIIAVCGGLQPQNITFSPKRMHRKSSIILPIVEYFANKDELHLTKIETLIEQYENILEKSFPDDTSVDIVDTLIALICLQGVSQLFVNQKYNGYHALPIALKKLKRTWFYLAEFNYITFRREIYNEGLIKSQVEPIMNMFLSQFGQSDEQCLAFYLACGDALDKLGVKSSSELFIFNIFRGNNLGRYLEHQPEFSHSNNERKINQMVKNIDPMRIFQDKSYFLLIFVPQSLQNLYYRVIIHPNNNTDSLPLVVLLSQCLTFLENVDKNDPNFCLALSMLQPQFEEHKLENYASVLFWQQDSEQYRYMGRHEEILKTMKDRGLLDPLYCDRPKDWETLINVERQRISQKKDIKQNEEKDLRLFAASISLARLIQARYHSCDNQSMKYIPLSIAESKEVHFAVKHILDPVLRIIAWNIILNMKDPLIFDKEQSDRLRRKMIIQLQDLIPRLPILTSTLLFVRCYTARQLFPVPFQHMAHVIGKKLNKTPIDGESSGHEAAFIALQQLNDSDLLHYLLKFVKRTKNLFDVLQFNSSIFFQYFTNTTSFDTENTTFLSLMYLSELAFHAQILQMDYGDCHKNKILPLNELDLLWNESLTGRKIMTYKVATWITNHLKILSESEIQQIIEKFSNCSMIERKALSEIEKWLIYRIDKDLRFFSYYAALQLIIEGSDNAELVDIIIEMFEIDNEFCLKSIVQQLFKSRVVDLTALRQILVSLHRHVHYSSNIHGWIDREDILKLVLDLEFERVSANLDESSDNSTKPYLLMVDGCSYELQLYLIKHLLTLNKEQNSAKEEYIAVLVKWIIESSMWNDKRVNFSQDLYEYIFRLLHYRRFSQVHRAVLNGLSSVFMRSSTSNEHVFLQDDAIGHLEKIIYSYHFYSEDIVTVCLLTYCNCLIQLKSCQVIRNLSNEIQRSFDALFKTSLSEVISIRAALCVIFAQESSVTFNTISDWFKNKWNLTPEKKYNVLLQQTLYKVKEYLSENDVKEIVEHLQINLVEIIDKFISELYNYLSKKEYKNYLSDPSPDYLTIALFFIDKNSHIFVSAVQKSWFGEDKFKRELRLYLYYTEKTQDRTAILKLYASFGVITVELIDMLEYISGYWCDGIWNNYLKDIKQVSDRAVVDKLFHQLNLTVYNTRFEFFSWVFKILVRLAQAHVVSLREVHQRVSLIINNWSLDDSFTSEYLENDIFHPVLDLSCIDHDPSVSTKPKLLTEIDIEKEFEKIIKNLEKKSFLFLRRNYFFTLFRPIPNGSNKEDRSIPPSKSYIRTCCSLS